MIFKKNKNGRYQAIEKALTLIQQKLLWLRDNNNTGVILLAGHDNKSIEALSERLFQKLTEDHSRSFLLLNLNNISCGPEEVDWDHELVIICCNDLNSCPEIYKFSNYIDTTVLMIEAGRTSRAAVKGMSQKLKELNVSISGSILHSFEEKIPSLINKVFR